MVEVVGKLDMDVVEVDGIVVSGGVVKFESDGVVTGMNKFTEVILVGICQVTTFTHCRYCGNHSSSQGRFYSQAHNSRLEEIRHTSLHYNN